jgi:hypothetical protein
MESTCVPGPRCARLPGDSPRSCPSPPGRRSLTTEVETGSVGVSPPSKTPGKAKNRAKSLVLEYFTLSHLESKTGPKISS